ncbi:GNAT family N-acetyltransferase [Enterobacter sp. NFIX58]|uniref:GNAT family N-acetyltransferase n=1 Tax=Enterobacter sp. NFIX58 TaxID=1566251 RepID=UPI0008BF5EF7|nr:GNAT family protein [Enterobacter sp. NFIX58]SEP34863.1 Protein N-acetyltransferase, RimJ/RimL family [Enterobacter sp. NFIX58]
MPVLITPRLNCSPLQEEDWPFFLALQQHPDVMRFVAEDRLVVRDAASRAPLGVTGYIHREVDCAEVGFLFAPEAQGKGYGFESLQALCRYAFEEGDIRRLTATVTAGNIASRRVLEKVRFRLEGELRESYFLAGHWHNDWLFGLLRHEYLNNKA